MSDLDVTYFQVMESQFRPEIEARVTMPVGPMFETPEQGREFLRRIRADHPHAYMVRAMVFVNENQEAELRDREEMLREIVPADEWSAEAIGLLVRA